jgi:hypothetical protein
MSGYMFWPDRAIFRQHILMKSTALCWLMSTVLIDVQLSFSQFWCFENVSSFSIFVLWLLGAPMSVPLLWLCVPRVDLVFLVTKSIQGTHTQHQINTRYTWPGEWHTQRGLEKSQYKARKRRDILKTPKLRVWRYTSMNIIDINRHSAVDSIKMCCLKKVLWGRNM